METITEQLTCSCCGKVMGSITGPSEGVERELAHRKEAKVSCSGCQTRDSSNLPGKLGDEETVPIKAKSKKRGRK